MRTSTIGLDWGDGIGFGGLGMVGHGSGGGGGGCGIGIGASYSPLQWLRSALGKALGDCGGAGRTLTASVETTSLEIVDVSSVGLDGTATAGDPKLRACVTEATWKLELPSFFDRVHTTYAVKTSVATK